MKLALLFTVLISLVFLSCVFSIPEKAYEHNTSGRSETVTVRGISQLSEYGNRRSVVSC